MGCDIHMYAEVRRGDEWGAVDVQVPNPYSKTYGGAEFTSLGDYRSYRCFAVLAGVRNSHGVRPIARPRGLPEDVSSEIARAAERWGSDGHSHSYLTLTEIEGFDWDQPSAVFSGWVSADEYAQWAQAGKQGTPSSYSGGVGGGGVAHISNEEMERYLGDGFPDQRAYYTHIHWSETYRDSASSFLERDVPALRQLGDPAEVRVVFWFDN